MSDGDELPPGAEVLRLPSVTFIRVSGQQRQPTPEAFALSSAERQALASGEPVRVSVWDRARIAVAEARAPRAGRAVEAFALAVADVRDVAEHLAHPALGVVRDPEGAPAHATVAQRAAHAGLTGLDVPPEGHPNPRLLKDVRDALARACRGPVG